METLIFSVFTILTLMAYLTHTKITAQESSFAPAPVAGAGTQPTVSRALLLFFLFIFYNYICNSLFSHTDDPDSLSIDSEQNLFANVISNNPSHYEELVPNEMGRHPHELFSDYNQISSLTSSDLQEIEAVGNIERDNAEQNNLHSENREEGTSPRLDLLAANEERVVLEEVDAVEKSSIDLNTLDLSDLEEIEPMDYGWLTDQLNPHVESRRENEERVGEYVGVIDLNTLVLSDSEEIEHHNLPTEERVDIEVVGLDKRVVVIDLGTLSSSASEEIEHMEYGRHIETTEPDEVDKQMHVNETTVDHKCSRGITLTDLQRQFGKKIKDAAASLGVTRSTFKRICRANGIARWSDKLTVQQLATATLTQSIVVKVSYNGVNVKFPLGLSSGKKDLEFEVEKRFGIQTGSFWIKYEDEDKDWILITCDEDLHHGMHTCIERGITTMKMHAG